MALGINNLGQVVGQMNTDCNTNNCRPHAFIWNNGIPTDLTPTAYTAIAFDINDAALVVGHYQASSGSQVDEAFTWQSAVFTTIPVACMGASATGVNASGVVIGFEGGLCGLVSTKAFHIEGGVKTYLSAASPAYAEGVSDGGIIAGTSAGHAALWSNHAPVANAGGPYTGTEGSAVSLTGAGSSDAFNDPLTYDWDFGDGSPHGSGVTPSHTYADNGSYTVTLTVNDGSATSSSSVLATISNATPTVTLTLQSPTPIHAGTNFTVRGGFADAGVADGTFTYKFFRNNTLLQQGTKPAAPPPGATQPVTLKLNTPGNYTLRLEVTDKDGAVGTKSLPVQIVP